MKMSIEQMQYGAEAPMEFNAGYERAQEEHLAELERLRDELLKSRDELVKSRDALARLQDHEAFTMTRNLYPLLEAVGGMLAPILEKRMKDFIELEVDRQLKDRTDIDRELVEGWIRDELENSETYYTAREIDSKFESFEDQAIERLADSLELDDRIYDYLSSNLSGEVRSVVQELSFSVTVD
jgi:uncharacterized protein YaaR (DUF327 family)